MTRRFLTTKERKEHREFSDNLTADDADNADWDFIREIREIRG
jgi:hypothetical protein